MDMDKLFESQSLDGVADSVFGAVNNSVSEVKEMQKKKVAENVQIVVQALKKIETDIRDRFDNVGNALEKRIITIKDGRDGIDGRDGKNGKDGRNGRDGLPGAKGADGKNGRDGIDGVDGVSVANARIDFDGSLIITLSNGQELNVGEVMPVQLAESIKIISGGGGDSQTVLDTLVSLQAQITALSSASVYKGTWNASTNTPTLTSSVGTTGNFYIVSTAGSTNLNGVTNWGVGDWAIFNGSTWQRVEGGADGNFVNLTTTGNVTLGDAVGDTITVNGATTFVNATPILTTATASRAVFTDASKQLVSNAITGTGNVVMSASPTLTGTVAGASLSLSSLTSGRVSYSTTAGLQTDSANLLYSGTDLTVYGLTVGRGAGAVASNTAVGASALAANTTGTNNTAIGQQTLQANTSSLNTAVGAQAGYNTTSGGQLVAIGYQAAYNNTTGADNVAIGGYETLNANTTGSQNLAIGRGALKSNTTSNYSTAVGYQSLYSNTGGQNTAVGSQAFYSNSTGIYNAGLGVQAGYNNTTGSFNTALGYNALQANTTASNSTAVGYQAGYSNVTQGGMTALGYKAGYGFTGNNDSVGSTFVGTNAGQAGSNSGADNTFIGGYSGQANTTGGKNVALGAQALQANTTASNGVAIGYQALYSNTTADSIVAIGHQAAYSHTTTGSNYGQVYVGKSAGYTNITGIDNTFVGGYAGFSTTGSYNTALGSGSLYNNSTGGSNTALGYAALNANTTASNNTAVGYQAGYSSTTGTGRNVSVGSGSLYSATTAIDNVSIGYYAMNGLTTGSQNVAIGSGIYGLYVSAGGSLTTGNKNTFVGCAAGAYVSTGSSNTVLGAYNGNQGGLDIRTASNYIVLSDGDGNARMFMNASGHPSWGAIPSGAGTNALKWNTSTGAMTYDTSSARYKDNIRDSKYGLNHVMQIRSAQFEYKDTNRSDIGLIAEELDLIIPELVGKNKDNEPDSVSYDRMVSVLVKAIQELKAEVDALKSQLNQGA